MTVELERADEAHRVRFLDLRRPFFASQIAAGLLDLPEDLEEMLETTTGGLLSSRRNDVVLATGPSDLGYVYATTRVVPGMKSGKIGIIEELYVVPECRKSSVATELVSHAIALLRERGADRIQTRVLAQNLPARAFWQRTGFVENVAIMELEAD